VPLIVATEILHWRKPSRGPIQLKRYAEGEIFVKTPQEYVRDLIERELKSKIWNILD